MIVPARPREMTLRHIIGPAVGIWIGASALMGSEPMNDGAWLSRDRGLAVHSGIDGPEQAPGAFTLFLPVMARPGDAPSPRRVPLDDLLSGITPAAAWNGTQGLGTVGRQFGAFTWESIDGVGAVALPGPGRAVAAFGREGYALVLTAAIPVERWRSVERPSDSLHVVEPPGVIGASIPLGGNAVDVRADEAWAYVAVASPPAIHVFDLREPRDPRKVGSLGVGGTGSVRVPQDLELADGVLWVSSAGSADVRLESWSLADAAAPTPLGRLDLPPAGGRRAMIAVRGGRVFTVGAGGILEVEVSDPTQPRLVGEIQPETPCLERATDVVAPPTQVGPPQLVVQGIGCLEWRVWIADAWYVDKSATSERAYEFPTSGSPLAAGPNGLLAEAHGAAGGITDWTAIPPNPMDLPGTAACLAVHDGALLAMAGDALWFLDPIATAEQATFGGRPVSSAPPARLGFSDPVRCALAPSEDRVVIAADDLYTIVDTSDPSRPEAGRASRIPQLNGAVAADARRAYLTAGENGLLVRALDPADTIGSGVMRTEGTAYDVAVADGHLFVADGPAGITVFDATGEELPRRVATLPMSMDARSLHYANGMLALTLVRSADSHRWWLGDFALAMVDVTSPLKPELRSVLDLPGASPGRPFIATRARQITSRVLVPAGDRLHAVDVTDPTRPHLDWTAVDPVRSAAETQEVVAAALGDIGLAVMVDR